MYLLLINLFSLMNIFPSKTNIKNNLFIYLNNMVEVYKRIIKIINKINKNKQLRIWINNKNISNRNQK